MQEFQFTVSAQEQGLSILEFLRRKEELAFLSQRQFKRLLDKACILVNGRVVYQGNKKLCRMDTLDLGIAEEFLSVKPRSSKRQLLYEDENLLILNKKAGQISDLHWEKELSSLFQKSLTLLHRLDRDTTGVILFFKGQPKKNKEDARKYELFSSLFSQRKIQKEYLAWVEGRLPQKKILCQEALVLKKKIQGQSIYTSFSSVSSELHGKPMPAQTLFEELRTKQWSSMQTSLLLCRPYTGRTHQIRVHSQFLGCPILGDLQYGTKALHLFDFESENTKPSGHLLHAWRVHFQHPLTGENLSIEAPKGLYF